MPPPTHSALACLLLLLLASAAAASAATATNRHLLTDYTLEAQADRVTFLPGGPAELDFNIFSGYVTVDEAAGRSLFYVFAEARGTDRPSEAPLLLWLNGGPGCSSLGGGFLSELGPFYPTPSGTALMPNPYSWNNLTNVLWLESPAFVGFSYSNSSEDKVVGDARTAADARLFLLHWMKRFPQFASSDLYLSGESYGGHYVPNLALEIVRGNKRAPTAAAASDTTATAAARAGSSASASTATAAAAAAVSPGRGHLNLKGFFVGNAWTDPELDNRGALDFWYSHAMISAESHSAITENCDFSVIGPLMRGSEALTLPGTHSEKSSSQQLSDKELMCARGLDIAQSAIDNINIYEIYADVCVRPPPPSANAASAAGGSSSSSSQSRKSYRGALLGHMHPRRRAADIDSSSTDAGGLSSLARLPRKPRYDPCIDGEVETYFNLPAVQAALHANQTVKLPWRWTDCTPLISYSQRDLLTSMLPVYHELLAAEPALKVWVFSGDVDGIVPVLGSRRWIESLQLPVTKPWRAWTSRTGQVGGWRIDYQGLTFATVRNAGHMVPYVTPERAFHLLGQFLFEADGSSSRGVGAAAVAAA